MVANARARFLTQTESLSGADASTFSEIIMKNNDTSVE
jgi:hypothetical protein